MKKQAVFVLAIVVLFVITPWVCELAFANGAYPFFGEFTVDGNNSQDNPLRISGLPTPCNVRITYSSGYFTNGGPMPGWGAYAGDCVSFRGASGHIGSPFRACYGPAGGYYYDLNQLLSCLTNLPPFEFSLEQGDWIEVHVWDDPGARCNTATSRCGSMSFIVEVVSVLPATYYVDAGATGANDGSSWADAYNYLQDGLAAAWSGDEIRVAQGIYKPDEDSAHPNGIGSRTATFRLKNGVAIKGGYAGFGAPDPDARDINAYETILSGDLNSDDGPNFANNSENSYRVLDATGTGATALLDEFIITGGKADGSLWSGVEQDRGAGMFMDPGSPTIINCKFKENWALRYGGGLYADEGSKPTLINCSFSANSAREGGGILFWNYCEPTLINCTFIGNSAHGIGDAIAIRGGGGLFTNHICTSTLVNCIFIGNYGRLGGGYQNDGRATLVNCTFVGNSATQGGGIYGGGSLFNCILWDNTPEQINGSIVATYCDVQSGWPGEGNIDADPRFVEPGYWDANSVWVDGDYHLMPGSPCIDAGDNSTVPADTTDLDGDGNTTEPIPWDLDKNPRIVDGNNDGNSVVDMGAYETVVPPMIEVPMKFTPQALNPDSKGNWVKAHFVLPEGFGVDDVDTNSPATVEPFGIESEYINVFVNEDGLVEIEAAFGRAAFCGAATDYGPVDVTVVGLLTTGQYFYGTDTIKIINKTFEYLGVLASHWLEAGCGAPDWCGGVDLDHNSLVDLVDFAMFDGCCIEVIRQ